MQDRIAKGLTALGLTPPPGAAATLAKYGELLIEQNRVMNLTAITDPTQVADLHFLDSAAVLTMEPATENGTWLANKTLIDVGTGGGFPGVPLKVLEPTLQLTLLDSLGKRVNWLSALCKALGAKDVACLHARGEEQALVEGYRDSFDFATSRAVASLNLLCELCLPYVKVGGKFLALKSTDSAEELAQAMGAIETLGGRYLSSFDYQIPNTHITHRVLVIEKIAPTPSGYPRRWAKIQKSPL